MKAIHVISALSPSWRARKEPSTRPKSVTAVSCAPSFALTSARLFCSAKCAVIDARVAPAVMPQIVLHAAPRAATIVKPVPRPASGASMSRVNPTSLITSAKSRHSLTLRSKPPPTPYEKMSEPNMPTPSRRTHAIAAAAALRHRQRPSRAGIAAVVRNISKVGTRGLKSIVALESKIFGPH